MDLALPSRRGLRPRARQIDRDLWLWFCRARYCHEHEGGPRVSKRVVQEEAKRAFHDAGITNFKASNGWYWRWLHRWRGLDPSSTSEKGTRGTEKIPNKTAEETLPKTVTAGDNPALEVTLTSTIDTPASKLSTPSTKDIEHPSIKLETVNCGDTPKSILGERVDPQVFDGNNLLCENNVTDAEYWSDYVPNGSLSQEMMELTENHFYHGDMHNSQIDPHNCIQIVNNQQSNMTTNGLDMQSGQMLQMDHLNDLDLAFNNQNTISGKFMSYDIHLSDEDVCLLNNNLTQAGSFSEVQVLGVNQQTPLQNQDLFFDSGSMHGQQTDQNEFCNIMPLQTQVGGVHYDKVLNLNSFGSNSSQHLNSIPENVAQTYLTEQLNQTSQICSAIEDLNPTLQSSKEVYDVIASMTSTLLSSSNNLADEFCMENDQSNFFGSKNGHSKIVFNDPLQIDSLDDIGGRDIDSRNDTNLMDVVLDPLQSNGQYNGSCDSGIDASPLTTEDAPTDFQPLSQNENLTSFGSNLSLDLSTSSPRDDDCDMFLNFNIDDSVGIADLISLGDPDDCMNDDDSLPEDYLEFIDNYSAQETTNDEESSVSSTGKKTEKSSAIDADGNVKGRRTGGERYLPYFKQRVLKYAAAHSSKKAAERFKVSVDSITLWALKSRQAVIKQNPEKHLLVWLRKCREMGYSITREQLQAKVRQLLSTGNGGEKKEESGWFYVWAKRMVTVDEGAGDEAKETSKSASKAFYPPAFKTEVALLAETTTKYNASLVFNVARKRVYEWLAGLRDITEDTAEINKSREETDRTSIGNEAGRPCKAVVQLKQRGRELTSSKIDKELLEWFKELSATTGRPTGSEVRIKAVDLFRSHGHNEINCSHGWYRRWCHRHGLDIRHSGDDEVLAWCLQELDRGRNISQRDLLSAAHSILSGKHKSQFKASAGWARRFAWRHGALFSVWPQLGPDTDLPSMLASRATAFRTKIQKLIKEHGWSPDVIGTMDEVPLSLTASGSSGRGTTLLRRPWPESVHATVILGCLGNGALLPPSVVLKGEGEPERVTVGKTTVLVFRQEGASVDENVLLQWLELVWLSSTSRTCEPDGTTAATENHDDSLLILDSYEPHGSPRVRTDLAARRCRLAMIPAGCGAVLLPLASAALQLFRTALEKEHQPGHHSGCGPLLTSIVSRVARAHASLATKKEILRTSFQSTGLIPTTNSEENLIQNSSTI